MLWRRQRIRNKKSCDVNQILPSHKSSVSFRFLFPLILFLWDDKFWWRWREVLNLFPVCLMTLGNILCGWDPVHMERPLQFSFTTYELVQILFVWIARLLCWVFFCLVKGNFMITSPRLLPLNKNKLCGRKMWGGSVVGN